MVSREPTRRRRPARSSERGATMFIVLMVLMILSAIGTFALSTARYEVQTSGYLRQRAIAIDATNYGGYSAQMALNPARASWYVGAMKAPTENCVANQGVVMPAPCYRLQALDIQMAAGVSLFDPYNASTNMPGSFGQQPVTAGFTVELTDPVDLPRPVAGFGTDDTSGTSNVKFTDVTITSYGVVWPDVANFGIVDASERPGATFATARGHVIVNYTK